MNLPESVYKKSAARSHQRDYLACILLVAALVSVYLPIIWCNFTNYDDPDYVLENPRILSGVTWEGLRWAFTHSHSGNWHPITWISHMLDCQFYDVEPVGHHVTSFLFHTANTLLLFGFLRFLTGAFWRSACVAALFGLHPLRVESVAWIAERKDVLSSFFGLLSLWSYTAYAKLKDSRLKAGSESASGDATALAQFRNPRLGILYGLSLVLFSCGLMSKSMLVTWPVVMLILDFWPLGRFQSLTAAPGKGTGFNLRTLLLEKLPFFTLAAGVCVITLMTQREAAALASLTTVSIGPRILNAVSSCFRYLEKLLWPTRLAVIYLDAGPPPFIMVFLATLALAIITLLAWRFRKNRPYVIAGWAWYLITISPVIGLIKFGNQSIADRYTYLPTIGLLLILVWGIAELIKRAPALRLVVIAAAMVLLTALASATQRQLLVWQNSETLFRHTLAVTKNNYIAYNSLGFYYADLAEWDFARKMFLTSLAIQPNDPPAWNKLGSISLSQGRLDEAMKNCQTALQLNPRMYDAFTTLGVSLMKQNRTNEAIASYAQALEIKPDYARAHYNLANAMAHQGRFDLARKHYEASLRTDPRSADAHNNLAYILVREQRLNDALAHFQSALRYLPRFWQAHYGLGEVLAKQGRLDEASKEFEWVTQLNPDLALAHFQLAVVLARQGKNSAALEAAGKAYRLATERGQKDLARQSAQLQDRLRSP